MRVLKIAAAACIRVLKEATALQKAGIDVHHMHMAISNERSHFLMPSMTFYDGPVDFELKYKMIAPEFDVVHVHNMPDWMCWRAKELLPDKPVVFDVHDMQHVILDNGVIAEDEVKAFRVADAYVFPSEAYQTHAHEMLNLGDKPRAVIYSMCTEDMIQDEPWPRTRGVVYQGGVMVKEKRPEFAYSDYREIAQHLAAMGIPFYLYGGDNSWWQHYRGTGAVCMPSLEYHVLLRELTRFDWVWVGPGMPHKQWNMAMPNKLFEAMAAGRPVIVWNASECAKFVQDHQVGIVLQDFKDLPSIYDNHEVYAEIVKEKRRMWTMETQTEKLLSLYRAVLGETGDSVHDDLGNVGRCDEEDPGRGVLALQPSKARVVFDGGPSGPCQADRIS